jgi:hypothetical protein
MNEVWHRCDEMGAISVKPTEHELFAHGGAPRRDGKWE